MPQVALAPAATWVQSVALPTCVGTLARTVKSEPAPSWPNALEPQQRRRWLYRAHMKSPPTASSSAICADGFDSRAGMVAFLPQHQTPPSWRNAHDLRSPREFSDIVTT